MARPATGTLILRASGYFARFWTTIDGERVRVTRPLGTKNRAAAQRKLERLLAAEHPAAEDSTRAETFREACERFYGAQVEAATELTIKEPKQARSQLRRIAYPEIGDMVVTAIEAADVNRALDAAAAAGLSKQSVQHLRQRCRNVFEHLRREGAIKSNPVSDASLPKFKAAVVKERATLSDAELAVYLSWSHPMEGYQATVLERQIMSVVARCFGGLRTGDLHALEWSSFDLDGFTFGWAPRAKTARPQKLAIPEQLRPFLRDWHTRAGSPRSGLVFPVRRRGKRGDRVGQRRIAMSHARAFRLDLERAFRDAAERGVDAPKPGTERWAEIFTETAYTLPVDFHSWRRSFAQGLADAGVNAQLSAALTGHASLQQHARYLRSAGKAREVPAAALPKLEVTVREKARGMVPTTLDLVGRATFAAADEGESAMELASPMLLASGTPESEPSEHSEITRQSAAAAGVKSGPLPIAEAVAKAIADGEYNVARRLLALVEAQRNEAAGVAVLPSRKVRS